MLTPNQKDFIEQFDAVAQGFDKNLECSVYTSLSKAHGAELTVVVMPIAAAASEVAHVKARTKAEAITKLTAALAAIYPAANMVALASTEAKQAIVTLLNHPFIDRLIKVNTLLSINRLTQAQAEAKVAALNARILHLEGRPYQVVAMCSTPAA